MIGEGEDLPYPEIFRLFDAGRDESSPYSRALGIRSYRERPDLGEVFPKDVQCADPFDLLTVLADVDVPNVFVKVVQGARYHLPLFCKFIDESVDYLYVSYPCFPYLQCSAFLS